MTETIGYLVVKTYGSGYSEFLQFDDTIKWLHPAKNATIFKNKETAVEVMGNLENSQKLHLEPVTVQV